MEEETNNSKLATVIASIGWLLLIVATGAFLLYGAPYYYEKGASEQFEQDIKIVDTWLRSDDAEENRIFGVVQSVDGNSIAISLEAEVANPLAPDRLDTSKIVVVDSNTKIITQTFLSPSDYLEITRAARDAGEESDNEVLPYTLSEGSISDLQVNTQISILIVAGGDRLDDTVLAEEISYIVYPDEQALQVLPSRPDAEVESPA